MRGGNITHAAAFGVGFGGGLLAPGPGLLAALGVVLVSALVAARHRR